MRISYTLPLEYSEHAEHTAHLFTTRRDVAAFLFSPVDSFCSVSRITGRKATFSHLPGYVFVMHKTPHGSYHLTEEHTGALCASIDFARSYENAFARLMDHFYVTDVLGSRECFEKAINEYLPRIRKDVQSLTDDPELFLLSERCRYRRERAERKRCMQASI